MQERNYQFNKEVCSILLQPHCGNNCIFCRPLGENSKKSAQELANLDKRISEAIEEFRKNDYTNIEVSGADPLEYKKLPYLIKILRQKGFKWIRISTNGVKLSNINFTERILKYGVDVFRIPLYGSNDRIHDSVTRIKGSFKHTTKGIKNIKKRVRILLISLLLKQNMYNLNQIFDLMHDLCCDDLYFAPVFISNGDYSYHIPPALQGPIFRKLIRHALKRQLPIRINDTPYCIIGFDNKFTSNLGKPAHLGTKFQPSEYQRTKFLDIPKYRLKIKVKMCKKCDVSYKCDGFLLNDILRYGIGNISPLKNNF